jgi:hypothetical protein
LLLPVAPAQIGRRDGQFLFGLPAAPIVFQREFQLTLAPRLCVVAMIESLNLVR